MTRTGRLGLATLLLPASMLGQQGRAASVPPNAVTMSFKFITTHFGGLLRAAFDSIPADKYTYRPTPPQQSIGYVAQHLEDANYALCERFGPMKHARTEKDELPDTVKATWPKDTLVARLGASFTFCDAAMAQLNDAALGQPVAYGPPNAGTTALPARALVLFVTDLAEHYSQVATYMRLLGMVPPSALPPRARAAIALPAAVLSQYAGTYDLPASVLQNAPAFVLSVTLKDGGLYIKPNGRPEHRLWPETATDFFIKEVDAQVRFVKDATGAVTGLVLHANGEDRGATRVR